METPTVETKRPHELFDLDGSQCSLEGNPAIEGEDPFLLEAQPVSRDEVTVVIPTLNEREAIGQVLAEVSAAGYRKVLVVDGYSTDDTPRIVKEHGVRLIQQHGNGKTGAISTALEHVGTPYTLVIDGDATYDPRDIDSMLAHARSYELVVGARKNGNHNIPAFHRLGNWAITKSFNLLLSSSLSDVCSGMYLFRTDAVRLQEFNSKGFSAEVEIASQLAAEGRVTDVPISYRKRVGRRKLSPLKDGVEIFTGLFGLARKHNPALLFTAVGSLAIIPGVMILGWVTLDKFATGVFHSGYALFGTMLVLMATQMFSIATISLLLKRTERRIARRLSLSS